MQGRFHSDVRIDFKYHEHRQNSRWNSVLIERSINLKKKNYTNILFQISATVFLMYVCVVCVSVGLCVCVHACLCVCVCVVCECGCMLVCI